MKTMKFRRFKADMIEQGKKTSSIRVFDDKALAKGDELELIVWETDIPFARAVITDVIEKPLLEISQSDLVGHEPMGDLDAMVASFKKYYPSVEAETLAKIVRFKIVTLGEKNKNFLSIFKTIF